MHEREKERMNETMKDYVGLSRVHFDEQAKDYDDKDTVYYSKYRCV